jgi:hypothetical protein
MFLFFEKVQKMSQLTKNLSIFYQTIVTKLSEIWGFGSEIWDAEKLIPDPVVKKAPDPQHIPWK